MEDKTSLYDWRDYLVIIIIGVIFFFASIDYFNPKVKHTIIYNKEYKPPFDKYKPEWTKK